MAITHSKVSTVPDSGDNSVVRPSDWNAGHVGVLDAANGGTGIANNAASTLAISGNFATTLTVTATTGVTLPTSGTLATLAGNETLTNKTLTSPIVSSISNSGTITVPTGTDTLVGKATTDILTNKTLTTPIITATTFANLPAASGVSGAIARVSNLGTATVGSLWISNGTVWKPLMGRVILSTLSGRQNVNGGGSELIAHQFQLPAALLNTLDRIRLWCSLSKAGTTTTGTLTVRMGTGGTTSDQAITGTGGAVLAAANRSVGLIYDFVVQSATSILKEGVSINGAGTYATAAATGYAAATTISNVSNSLFISVTVTPGATDATALEDSVIELITS